MKAMLEFDAPESCEGCKLSEGTFCRNCKITLRAVYGYNRHRPDFCPLKIVPDGDGWISVEERLPEEGIRVLIWFVGCKGIEDVEITELCHDGLFRQHRNWPTYFGNVTHWRELPPPPEVRE